ncbi:DNA repair endonuclease XPF isoform X2 [Drosophila kikkawai]|uniref:DNA repair endonuclease XPF isoform X2 n=1 Tax=Drosophila kikkawai TaxID=30033 RepID=A0ABM4GP64_DROKI
MSDSVEENGNKEPETEPGPDPEPETETDPRKLLETTAACQEDEDLATIVTAEEYLMHKDVVLLEYEKQMFLDTVHADGLLVCAKGLSYERVLINILKAYSDAGNLVLVINSSDWEEQYFKSKMEAKYVHEVANMATERERVYLEGGLQFISTRILVVDLLKQRIPIELISGIIVLRAHTIIESCQEAFALRLYRQKNKTGFVKAFSSSPEAFTIGYSHVERTMRNLFVKNLYIWPRFHATVRGSLQPWQAQTIELHVPLSPSMTSIQTHILDIMNFLVREIKRINRTVDLEAVTVENCVTKKFHKILQAQLDCIWHQLNSQTKLIVADLKILRSLMISTMYHDSVSAYALMKRYRSTEYALSNSGWTLLDAAEQIFKLSRQRVFNGQQEFEPEPCPKWQALTDLLTQDIPGDMKRCKRTVQPKVLILCQDARTCYQLKMYLTQGGARFLLQQALHHEVPVGKLSDKYAKESQANKINPPPTKATKSEAAVATSSQPPAGLDELAQLLSDAEASAESQRFEESYMLTMTQPAEREKQQPQQQLKTDPDVSIFETIPELEEFDVTAALELVSHQPYICLQTFKTEREGSMALEHMLEQLQPHYVIMYNTNITAIRQLEVFEARRRLPAVERLKVYFLIHARTVEEQAYLTSLRREKAAFELIIDTKSKMVIPEYQDGKTDEAFVLYKNYDDELSREDNAKSRQAGGQKATDAASKQTPKIIVDMREFRSDLPCLIHKRGLEVLPLTITIGDYILTPEICVERQIHVVAADELSQCGYCPETAASYIAFPKTPFDMVTQSLCHCPAV